MRYLLLVVLLFVASCGGGGGQSSNNPAIPPPQVRSDLLFGYYGSDLHAAEETLDHTNVVFLPNWGTPQSVTSDIVNALTLYNKAIVALDLFVYDNFKPRPDREQQLYQLMVQLQNANVLHKVIAWYPLDEPDINGPISSSDQQAVAQSIKKIATQFSATTTLAVIYGPTNEYVGIENYDWIGTDNYNLGAQILTLQYPKLISKLTANQKLIVIPGGGNPWKIDPTPFYEYAQNNQSVIAIIPFIWSDYPNGWQQLGIRSNGMATMYKNIGTQIKNNSR